MPRLSPRVQSTLVVVLSALVLAFVLPAATVGWAERGTWGINGNFVRSVDAGSPAALAGIEPGDRIRFGALPLTKRMRIFFPIPGERLTVPVEHAGADGTILTRNVTMTAATTLVGKSKLDRWLTALEFLTYIVFVAVGTTLVYLRPSPMTWWLWFYCSGWVPIQWIHWHYSFLPDPAFTALFLVDNAFIAGGSTLPLLPFLLRFPNDRLSGWRSAWRGPIATLVVAGYVYYIGLAFWRLSDRLSRPQISFLDAAPASGVFVLAAVLLLVTFARAEGADKPRLRWAVFGMLFSFFSLFISYVPVPKPQWFSELTTTLSVTMPLSIAYATLRHRLLDVRFVINNAVVYGSIAAVLIAFVSLLDFSLSHLIADYHLTLGIEAAITIGLGFILDRLHGAMERAAERVFFRSRLIAAERLRRVRGALAYASRDETIQSSLIDEPVAALALASAALFRKLPDGRFARTHALGWNDATLAQLDADDALVRTLQFERKALDPTQIWGARDDVPPGAGAPALAAPIFSRESLEGLVVYGAHRDQTEIDPGEADLLSALCEAAAAAFDHVAYERSQETIEELRRRLAAPLAPPPALLEGLPPL
jgi:hypothetical protein